LIYFGSAFQALNIEKKLVEDLNNKKKTKAIKKIDITIYLRPLKHHLHLLSIKILYKTVSLRHFRLYVSPITSADIHQSTEILFGFCNDKLARADVKIRKDNLKSLLANDSKIEGWNLKLEAQRD
jgi:hypothetical protein